jgi:hypothetical protein
MILCQIFHSLNKKKASKVFWPKGLEIQKKWEFLKGWSLILFIKTNSWI